MYPRLLADIGGTHARFAHILAPGAAVADARTLSCADYPSLLAAIRAYLDTLDSPPPRCAAIGIANPVTGDWLHMTNRDWAFSQRALREELKLEHLVVLNDFTLLALSLPTLRPRELRPIGGGLQRPGPLALIGPGTGLGVSALIPVPPFQISAPGAALPAAAVADTPVPATWFASAGSRPRWIPLQSEGGHAALSPGNPREDAVLAQIRLHLAATPAGHAAETGAAHVSAERVLSGQGIVNLYRALCALEGIPPDTTIDAMNAAAVVHRADVGDALCHEALHLFCGWLGDMAANIVLTIGACGGVYLGGGVIPRLGRHFSPTHFRARFEHKGRLSSYLRDVPCYLIEASNPALRGAAAALET